MKISLILVLLTFFSSFAAKAFVYQCPNLQPNHVLNIEDLKNLFGDINQYKLIELALRNNDAGHINRSNLKITDSTCNGQKSIDTYCVLNAGSLQNNVKTNNYHSTQFSFKCAPTAETLTYGKLKNDMTTTQTLLTQTKEDLVTLIRNEKLSIIERVAELPKEILESEEFKKYVDHLVNKKVQEEREKIKNEIYVEVMSQLAKEKD